jgi:predicted 3-demethylubiquinone-9 3-methyltransferase (glyoxalase superfamily)
MRAIAPCLWFDDAAEAAAELYVAAIPGSRRLAVTRYPERLDNPTGRPPGSVLTVEVELGGVPFTLLDGGPTFRMNPSISFFVHTDADDETDRLHAALADGGKELMPLGDYPWSPRYAWVEDRFGASWQILQGRRGESSRSVMPCLMFTGAQAGRAEEAIRTYVGQFPGSRLVDLARYGADEGPEGSVKHGRFELAGQPFVAMDSHFDHGFGFNEGISLQVLCDDQEEIDRWWSSLADGGEEGPCGWLKDRFGLSWQVAPAEWIDLYQRADDAARARIFQVLLGMKKLDAARLRAAFAG